jgi:hypothetical protein
MSDEDIKIQCKESYQKEHKALLTVMEPSRINFAPLIVGNTSDQFVEELPSNPYSANIIQEAVMRWLRKVRQLSVIYPVMSSQSVSMETTTICQSRGYIGTHGISTRINQVDLERVYHHYHEQIYSINEMRQVYYPAQFAVRTYYASGSYSYHKTKYIKTILTLLCDELAPSHRKLRENPGRLVVEDDEYALCYDFTSYTTALRSHVDLIRWLKESTLGIEVVVMDAIDGPISVSLSTLFQDLEDAHTKPEIYIKEYILGGVVDTLVNLNGGLLGISGNITSAIVLHAIIGIQLVTQDPTNKINTPGDDGIIIITDDGEVYVLVGLKLIGSFQMTKIYKTKFTGCLHLKRTIKQWNGGLIMGQNVYFPSFEYERNDDNLDARYIRQLSRMDKYERKQAAASSVLSFLKSLQFVERTEDDVMFLSVLFDIYYKWFSLSYMGCVPQFEMYNNKSYFCCCCPSEIYNYDRCPIEYTIKNQNTTLSRLPRRRPIDRITDLRYVRVGYVFESNGSKLLTYIEKLGYVRKKVVYDYIMDDTVYQRTISEYKERHEYSVYEYEVVKKIFYRFIQHDYLV